VLRILLALVATCQAQPTYRVGCVYETAVVTAFVLAPSRARCRNFDDPNVLAFSVLQTQEAIGDERTRWIVPMKQLATNVFGIAGYRIDQRAGFDLRGTVSYSVYANGTFMSGEVPLVDYTAGD
jgi:hypothetical protein